MKVEVLLMLVVFDAVETVGADVPPARGIEKV